MQRLRLGLPILAFVLAVATSAFTIPRASSDDELWEYLGPVGDEDNEENYFLVSGSPQNQCGTDDETVCTILAESDGDPVEPHPILNGANPMTDPGFATTKRAD